MIEAEVSVGIIRLEEIVIEEPLLAAELECLLPLGPGEGGRIIGQRVGELSVDTTLIENRRPGCFRHDDGGHAYNAVLFEVAGKADRGGAWIVRVTGRRYTIQPCSDGPEGMRSRRVGIDHSIVKDAFGIRSSVVELAVSKDRRGRTIGKDVAIAAGESGLVGEMLIDFDIELQLLRRGEDDPSIIVCTRNGIAGGVGRRI